MPRGSTTFPTGIILNPVTYAPRFFVIDGLEGPYEGFTDGTLWNGWACPVFTRDVADQIVKDFNRQGERHGLPGATSVEYDPHKDSYAVTEEGNDPIHFGTTEIDVGGRSMKVYEFGTCYWTWEEA